MNVSQNAMKKTKRKKAVETTIPVSPTLAVSSRMKATIEGKMAVAMGKKVFVFVEQTEGGMDVHVVTSLRQLAVMHGWMTSSCWMEDLTLLDWFMTADIGDVHHHRLGIVIRVKDATV